MVKGLVYGQTIVTYFNRYGCKDTSIVNIDSLPIITGVGVSPTNCTQANGSITISGLIVGNNYLLQYTKSGSTPAAPISISNAAATNYVVNNLTAGTYNIYVKNNNGCQSDSIKVELNVPQRPAMPNFIGSNAPICSGDTLKLFANSPESGVAYNWFSNKGYTSSDQNPVIPKASSFIHSATYTVNVTKNGCTSKDTSILVVVDSTPAKPTIKTNSPLCEDSTLELSAVTATQGLGNFIWTWTGPSSFSGNDDSVKRVGMKLVDAGFYVVKVTLGNCSSKDSVRVIVNPTPRIQIDTFINPATCGGLEGKIKIKTLAPGNYVVSFKKNGIAQPAQTLSPVSGVITISNLDAGDYSDIKVISSDGCPSKPVGPVNLKDPNPPATPKSNNDTTVCSGNNVTFSVKNPVATINYIWNGPGLSSANVNSTSVTINTTNPAQSGGIYSVYADSAGCKSKADTMVLTVLQTPSKPVVNGPVYYCQFDIAAPLTAVASSGSTLRWYDSAMKLLPVAPIPQTNVVRTYKYYVTQRNITDTCQSQKDSISVIIKPKPKITGYKRNPINCATATGFIILKGLNPGSYQVKYDTSGVPVVRSISTLNDSLIVDNLVAQTYSNIHVLLSGCPSDTINQFILSDPNPPDTPNLQSNAPVCSGNTINVSVNNTVTGGVYSWSGPKGTVSGASGTSISVSNSTKADSGLYKVYVTLNNCKSITGEINVIVNQTPPAPTVITPIYYCRGDVAQALTATTLDANHFLRWYTLASGGVGSAIAPVPSTQNTGTTTYYVSQISSDSCEGPRVPINVIIREIPEIADVNKTVCSGEKIFITPSGPGVPASTQYYWYMPAVSNADSLKDASADSLQTSFHDTLTNVSDFVQTALYTVYPITNYIPTLACPGKPFRIDVTVNPSPKIRFSIPNDTICSGGQTKQVTLISPTPGAVISWNSPSVTGISGNNPSGSNVIPVQTLDNATVNPLVVKYIAQAVNSGGFSCPGITSTYEVTVAPTPDIKNKMISICSGSSFEHDPALSQPPNRVPVNTKYTWTISTDNSNIKGQNGQTQKVSVISDTLTNTSNIPQKIVYTVQSYSGDLLGCSGNPFTIEVTVNPTPVILPLYDTICSGNSFDLKPTNAFPDTLVPVNTTYSWIAPVAPAYIRGLALGNSQASIAGLLFNDSYAPYTVIYKVIPISGDQGSCIGDTFDVLITVNPLASISNNPLNQELCDSNNSVAVTWTSFSAGATYSWKLVKSGSITGYTGDGAGNTLPSMFLGNNLHYPDTLRYAVSSTANECAAPATNYDIIVNPDSRASYTYTRDTACWPFNINNTVINNISTFWVNDPTVPNDRFEWYAIDGGGNGNLIGNSRSFPGYTIPGPGDSILIKLVVRNKFKCKDDSVSHWFFTSPKPLAVFSLSPGNGCGPLTVSFTNQTALKDSFEYFWNFGNQQFSTLADPPPMVFLPDTVRFIDTTYYVVLRVNNECDTSYATIPVTVNSKPKARFLPSSSKICSNTKIKLKNTSLGFGNTYEWHFNDGSPVIYKNDSSDVEHVYNTSTIRTFVDTLIAINQCGRDTTTYPILVTPITIKPNFLVTADTKVGCAAHTVTLQNLSTGGTRFEWYFAFPDTSVKQVTTANTGTISHTYTRAGRYLIKLRALNECSDTTDFDSVVVLRTPKPDFSFNGNSICVGQQVSFLNQTDTANLYSWHFGNGDTSKSASPAYSFSTPGRYTIKLVAGLMDLSGVQCKDSIERVVVIVDSLPGSFSVSADTGYCTPFSVTFTNQTASSGTPVWDFGDGSPLQYGNSVTHTYDSAGKFIAHMAVSDPAGCKYGMKKEIVIAGPYGALNYDGDLVCGNKAVRFEAVVFNTDSIQWDFGDGNTLTTKSRIVFHSYSVPGQFIPSIILISPSVNGTCRISLPGTKVIKVDYLNAGFSHAATNYCDSTVLQLQDTATAYSGIQSWEWTLGNGSILNNQNPAVPYYSTNNYPVKQVIQSNWGCTDTAAHIIPVVVNASPSAAILALNKACEGDTVKFISNINSQDSVNLIKWEGVAGYYGKEIILPFSTPGTYNLKLIAGTIYGCFDTADASIVIHPLPELIAKESKTICQGQSTQLLAVTNATNVRWTPSSSLSCSDCINPVATPSSSTSYVAVATSNQGCRSADTVVIMVKLPIDIDVSGNDTICIGESTSLLVTGSGAVRYAWSPATSISCTDCTNPVVNPDASTRYMVVGYDSKNNTELCFTDTAYVEVTVGHYPIVTLPADTLIQTGSVLRPDPDITYGNGIVFEPIRTFTWSPLINIDSANFEIPKITVRNNICYKLDVENIYGCKSSDEFCIKVFCENSQVFIPNAFTPTQSTNRRFWVRTKGINKIKTFRVFNRWGEVVFEKNNFTPLDGIGIQNPPDDQGWDGKVRGVWANTDVYVYIVEVVCDNEVPFFYKGNVTLIR
jgi:PKD repeat protein